MKNFTSYLDNVTIVFSSMAILFVFMFATGYYVVDNISSGSSAQMLKEQKQKQIQ